MAYLELEKIDKWGFHFQRDTQTEAGGRWIALCTPLVWWMRGLDCSCINHAITLWARSEEADLKDEPCENLRNRGETAWAGRDPGRIRKGIEDDEKPANWVWYPDGIAFQRSCGDYPYVDNPAVAFPYPQITEVITECVWFGRKFEMCAQLWERCPSHPQWPEVGPPPPPNLFSTETFPSHEEEMPVPPGLPPPPTVPALDRWLRRVGYDSWRLVDVKYLRYAMEGYITSEGQVVADHMVGGAGPAPGEEPSRSLKEWFDFADAKVREVSERMGRNYDVTEFVKPAVVLQPGDPVASSEPGEDPAPVVPPPIYSPMWERVGKRPKTLKGWALRGRGTNVSRRSFDVMSQLYEEWKDVPDEEEWGER